LLGGFVGVGATAFYYQQNLRGQQFRSDAGDFKGARWALARSRRTRSAQRTDGAVEIKWLPELETKNRINGNSFWIKARAVF